MTYKLWGYTYHPSKFRTGHILAVRAALVDCKNSPATCLTPVPEMGMKNPLRRSVGVAAFSHYRYILDKHLRLGFPPGKSPNPNTYPQFGVLALWRGKPSPGAKA